VTTLGAKVLKVGSNDEINGNGDDGTLSSTRATRFGFMACGDARTVPKRRWYWHGVCVCLVRTGIIAIMDGWIDFMAGSMSVKVPYLTRVVVLAVCSCSPLLVCCGVVEYNIVGTKWWIGR